MEINVTFNPQKFIELGIPQCERTYLKQVKIPNLKVGKTYYKLIEGALQGFRILAITIASKLYDDNVHYLIQTPNQSATWKSNYVNKEDVIFENKDYLLPYLQGNANLNVNKDNEWCSVINYYNTLKEFHNEPFGEIYHSWYINNKTKRPCVTSTPIKHLLILEDSVEICLSHDTNKYFKTKEECLANYLNGFIIDDFAEEQKISIKVLPNTQIKKVLQVIEINENE